MRKLFLILALFITEATYSQNHDQSKSLNNSSSTELQQVENETADARPTLVEKIPLVIIVILSVLGFGILILVVALIRKSLHYDKRIILGGLNKGFGVGFITNTSPVKRRRSIGSGSGFGGISGGGFGTGISGGW